MEIKAQLIMEVLGKPREYVKEVLEDLGKQIGNEAGVSVTTCSIGEPRETKDSKDVYTGFLDIEVECEKIENLMMLCFKYMPAHVELFSPEKINFNNVQINELLNAIIAKLHSYDEITRILSVQKIKLEQEIIRLRENLPVETEKTKKKTSKTK